MQAAGIQQTASIYQDLFLVSGSYDLGWLESGRNNQSEGAPYSVMFGLAGGPLDTVASFTGPEVSTAVWTECLIPGLFAPANGIYRLQFQATGSQDRTTLLDDVSLTSVPPSQVIPEPGTGMVLAVGLGSLVAFLRRKRRSSRTGAAIRPQPV